MSEASTCAMSVLSKEQCQTDSLVPQWVAIGFGGASAAMVAVALFFSIRLLMKRKADVSLAQHIEKKSGGESSMTFCISYLCPVCILAHTAESTAGVSDSKETGEETRTATR